MLYSEQHLQETIEITKLIDPSIIEKMAEIIANTKGQKVDCFSGVWRQRWKCIACS